METKISRPSFDKTVSILVAAYLVGELQHEDCKKCVVGNLCGGKSEWQYLFMTDPRNYIQHARQISELRESVLGKRREQILQEAQDLCLSTGYTIDELKRIEFAFETAPGFKDNLDDPLEYDDDGIPIEEQNEDWMFNGLMAVVDVLADIHGVSLEQKTSSKKLFVKV